MTEYPAFDFAAVMRRAAEQTRREDALLSRNKALVLGALEAAGVARVEVEFDGGGDSGQIESVRARDADGAEVELPDDRLALCLVDGPGSEPRSGDHSPVEAIETLVYGALACRHGGWENNEGGYGTVLFDVADRSMRLEMHERVVETVFAAHEF